MKRKRDGWREEMRWKDLMNRDRQEGDERRDGEKNMRCVIVIYWLCSVYYLFIIDLCIFDSFKSAHTINLN